MKKLLLLIPLLLCSCGAGETSGEPTSETVTTTLKMEQPTTKFDFIHFYLTDTTATSGLRRFHYHIVDYKLWESGGISFTTDGGIDMYLEGEFVLFKSCEENTYSFAYGSDNSKYPDETVVYVTCPVCQNVDVIKDIYPNQ